MRNDLQHPAITRAICCGVDEEIPKCYCDGCGEPVYYGQKTFTSADGRVFCEECMENEISELGIDYVAEALGWNMEES